MDSPFFFRLFVAAAVGAAASHLGSLMINRKMALVGDALGHVALPGMGFAVLLGFDPSIGAATFLLTAVLLVWLVQKETGLASETTIGILFVSSLALGFLIIPEKALMESLVGEISQLTPLQASISVVLSLFILFFTFSVYPSMTLFGISPELAWVEGFSERKNNLLFLFAIALIVSVGVRITGSLLVGALVIVPPATARTISRNLTQYSLLSVVFGVLSGVCGVFLAHFYSLAIGPTIILVSVLFFSLAVLLRRALAFSLQS